MQMKSSAAALAILSVLFSFPLIDNDLLLGQQFDEEMEGRFYFTLQGIKISGAEYPNAFSAYKATGPAATNVYYVNTLESPSGSTGLGGAFGYNLGHGLITLGCELEFAYVAHPESKETLDEDLFNGTTFAREHYSTQFTQSERKNISLLASGFFGMFPFSSFELGLYISAGVGYGWQSFHSEATKYAEAKGYNTKTVGESDWFDLGEYSRGGNYSRGSVIYFVGLAAEFYLLENVSVKMDYKYIASSYSKENVLISSGPVNVYQDSKSYEYTFANKFALGFSYYFNL